MKRHAHLVGSIPEANAEEAMVVALDHLGPHLRTLPDGETGERRNWIIHIIESLRDHPDLELAEEGDWDDYDDTPRFKVPIGHRLDGRTLDFGHVEAFEASYPLFRELRERYERPHLDFQVGIPGDFDMALFVLGPTGPFLHRWPFTVATLREIHAIHARGGDDVVFQIEVPAELVFVAQMPSPLQPLAAAYLARGIANLADRSPGGARFGVHLCLGDMNHRALATMEDVRPLVLLANAVARRWPSGRPLEFVHAPFAAAEKPPRTDRVFYAPLADLDLPEGTRFVAGFVHEDQPLSVQRELLGRIEAFAGRRVDVAATCGLGRRDEKPAFENMEYAAQLCSEESV